MDEETRSRAFDPFFTTKANVGTGLGLSTVHGSISNWGGQIGLESKAGSGSKFTVALPIGGSNPVVREEGNPPEQPQSARIIAIEDEEIVREVINQLASVNHRIVAYGDGETALADFAVGQYDIALISLGMPRMSGDKLAKALRERDSDLITILVSEWQLDDDDGRPAHFDLQIRKPIESLQQLDIAIAQALKIRNERRK